MFDKMCYNNTKTYKGGSAYGKPQKTHIIDALIIDEIQLIIKTAVIIQPLPPAMGLATVERKHAHVMAHVTNERTDWPRSVLLRG